MSAMDQELNMYQSHLSEYKLEIDRLNKVINQINNRNCKTQRKNIFYRKKGNNNKEI